MTLDKYIINRQKSLILLLDKKVFWHLNEVRFGLWQVVYTRSHSQRETFEKSIKNRETFPNLSPVLKFCCVANRNLTCWFSSRQVSLSHLVHKEQDDVNYWTFFQHLTSPVQSSIGTLHTPVPGLPSPQVTHFVLIKLTMKNIVHVSKVYLWTMEHFILSFQTFFACTWGMDTLLVRIEILTRAQYERYK